MKKIDATEQINRFHEFMEAHYYSKYLDILSKGNDFLEFDFVLLSKFDPDLAQDLLNNPSETLKAAEIAIGNFETGTEIESVEFSLRVFNLPESTKVMIRDVRGSHLDKFIKLHGIVRQKSKVRLQVTSSRFDCPSCGTVLSVLQIDNIYHTPNMCSCGRKGKFRLISEELIDCQGIVLEEIPEELEGGEQPKRINIFLKRDLASPLSEKKNNPGSKIMLSGILKKVPIFQAGQKLTSFDFLMEANYMEAMEEDFSMVNISDDEKKRILELAADPNVFKKLVGSFAPSIYGHTQIKEALLLQLFAGVRKTKEEGKKTRADIHILLVGDPGAGKSELLKSASIVAPKSRHVSGKGASGAGLTSAVVKDEFLKGWSLEAGALVLAHKGICMIDELDKMSKEDSSAMHEALEQQTVTIAKANIQATLRAETSVLAAANPKWGRFDPYVPLAAQIDLVSTLINRFDLIFPIRDIPDKEKDDCLARFILNLHSAGKAPAPEIESGFLRKYIAYARQTCFPKITPKAIEHIREFYVNLRSSGSSDPDEIKSIPISARQLEALIRLTEASAKSRLSKKATKEDAKKAIELVYLCLSQVGMDLKTGKIDMDRISTGITTSERGNIIKVEEIIKEIEKEKGNSIPMDLLKEIAAGKGISDPDLADVIEKLKRTGDIFESKPGYIVRIN